ncbi:MAG: DUF4111 domain-containing protein [Oscillospiraceae bacterium]|jgi:streptomycin 3"-adenylyltransferase|nr:DUF4111 domain-containing protein [Oscillospiraceae bacterium]
MINYNLILRQVKDSYTELLQDNLTGIYVHGSIAFNCFNPDKSDIDYIAVINSPLTPDIKSKLIKETLRINKSAPKKGLEMSVVLKEHCVSFKHPAPFELHFSNTHCETTSGVDKDLAAHFTIIKNAGVVLYGEPIDSVFGEVPKADYFDSIKSDIENAGDEISYNRFDLILNLCRVLAYKQDGLILSKEAGGKWGLENVGEKYRSVIKTAFDRYLSAHDAVINHDLASDFYDYMLSRIS